MAGSLAPVMYWAVHSTTGQDALDGAAVEPFEDLGTHAKVLSCPLHDYLGMFGP